MNSTTLTGLTDMRMIKAGLFIALDGVVEAPDQWHFPYFTDEMGAAVDATLGAPGRAAMTPHSDPQT